MDWRHPTVFLRQLWPRRILCPSWTLSCVLSSATWCTFYCEASAVAMPPAFTCYSAGCARTESLVPTVGGILCLEHALQRSVWKYDVPDSYSALFRPTLAEASATPSAAPVSHTRELCNAARSMLQLRPDLASAIGTYGWNGTRLIGCIDDSQHDTFLCGGASRIACLI